MIKEYKMQKHKKTYIISLIIGTILIFDQLSKWYVTQHFFDFESTLSFTDWLISFSLPQYPFESKEITSFFNIVMVWNKGISFGLLGYAGDWMVYLLIALTLGIVGFLFYMMKNTKQCFAVFSIAMIIGGALGNIWDRLRFGAVADFIDFHYQGMHYPAFNIADACITSGVVLYLFFTLLNKEKGTIA